MDKILLSQLRRGVTTQRATQVSLSQRTPKIPTWMVEIGWFWTARGQHSVALMWLFLPAAQKGTPLSRRTHWATLIFFWSLAIGPRPWKGLWISNKLNLQESGAIETERDNFIPALARQCLDAAHYKMSCQFWVWEHTPKQVNPSLTGVPQQGKRFTELEQRRNQLADGEG